MRCERENQLYFQPLLALHFWFLHLIINCFFSCRQPFFFWQTRSNNSRHNQRRAGEESGSQWKVEVFLALYAATKRLKETIKSINAALNVYERTKKSYSTCVCRVFCFFHSLSFYLKHFLVWRGRCNRYQQLPTSPNISDMKSAVARQNLSKPENRQINISAFRHQLEYNIVIK